MKSYLVKDSIQKISKTRYWDSSDRKTFSMNRETNFLVFVQFGEKSRQKRFDPNNLKTRYLDSSKRKNISMNRKTNFLSVCKTW